MQQDFESSNSPDSDNKNQLPSEDRAKNILSKLNSNLILVGKTLIHPWKAWLLIGIAAGSTAGILLIANFSGQLDTTGVERGNVIVSPATLEEMTFGLLKLGVKITAIETSSAIANAKPGIDEATAIIFSQNIETRSPEAESAVALAVQLAKKRQVLLETLLAQDRPAEVLKFAYSKKIRDSLPTEVQPYIETEVTPTGEFQTLHIDYPNGSAKFRHLIKLASGKRLDLYFAGEKPEEIGSSKLKSGATVKISGFQIGEAVAVESANNGVQVLAAPKFVNSLGLQKTAVLILSSQIARDATIVNVNEARNVVFDSNSSVNKLYQESSYNQTSLSGDVLGPYSISSGNSGCDYLAMASQADQAATAAGTNLSSYTRKIYALPPANNCVWLGVATLGGNQAWISESFVSGVVAHEMGHNLGLLHSHAYECGNVTLGANCSNVEYGDVADTMGVPNPPKHFNAPQKDIIGWLNYGASPTITSVTTDGAYTISAYESASPTPHALKIKRPGTNDLFYVELRQPIGFDSALVAYDATIKNGVLIHYVKSGFASDIYLLDMTPQTYSWYDSALQNGQTFQDPNTNLRISLTNIDPVTKSATVNVSLGNASCVHQNPSVSLSPLGQYGTPGQALTYTATLVNKDSATCGSSIFNLTGSGLPSGWSFSAKSVSVAAGGNVNTPVVVTSLPTAGVGSYNFTLIAANSADATKSVSIPGVYNVQPTTPPPPPPPPGSTFNDDFNRSDSDGIGNGWQIMAGGFATKSNELRNTISTGFNLAVLPSFTFADGIVATSFAPTDTSAAPQFGIVFRYKDATNYYKAYRLSGSTSQLRISKIVNGTETVLKSISIGNPTQNSFFRLQTKTNGQTLSLYYGDALALSVTDATFSSGSVGIVVGRPNYTLTTGSHRIDNFSVSASGTPPPPPNNVTYAKIALPSNNLINGSNIIYRFSETAVTSNATVNNAQYVLSQTGISVSKLKLIVYSDAGFTQSESSTTLENPTIGSSPTAVTIATSPSITIPAGTTKYFELRALAADSSGGDQMTAQFANLAPNTIVSTNPPSNIAPAVNAGPDQSVSITDRATLNGSATDDGKPNPPGALTYSWSKISGSGNVSFTNASSGATTASFSAPGAYVLRLTANDSALSGTDDVSVTVTVSGSFSDDFNRTDSTSLGSNWQEVAGSLQIQANQLRNDTSIYGDNMAVVQGRNGQDQVVSADFTSTENNGSPALGVILRYQDSSNYYYVYRATGATSQLRISKIVNGKETILKSVSLGNPVRNSTFQITGSVVGTTITFSLSGNKVLSASDSTFATGSAGVNVRVYNIRNSHIIDNFSLSIQ